MKLNLTDALTAILNNTLISIDLRWNYIGVEGANALASALIQNHTLTSINLGISNIGDLGAKDLAFALRENHTLTSINLGISNIGDQGAKELGFALRENHTLTSINLEDNHIGVEGGKALASALIQNHTLTSIDLRWNNIRDEGAKALAFALKENHTLTSIDLSWNNIGVEGGKALAFALKENHTLTSLDLVRNNIGVEGAKAFAFALKENHTLTSIDSTYQIPADILEEINADLEINKMLASLKNIGLYQLHQYTKIIESLKIESNRNTLLEKMKAQQFSPGEISETFLQVIDQLMLATADPERTIETAEKTYQQLHAVQDERVKSKAQNAIDHLADNLKTVGPVLFSKEIIDPFRQLKEADAKTKNDAKNKPDVT